MKKLPVILNVILLIAVAVLYVLHFSGSSNTTETKSDTDSPKATVAPTGNIVYINIDSVYSNYEMYKDITEELKDKVNTSEAQLQTKQRNFQKKVKDFQYKVERQLVTRTEAAELQQTLGKEEQDLMALQNQLQYQLAEEQQVAQRKVLNSIMEYLKSVEEEQAYQFILGNSFGGNIMYANEQLDISKSVIEGLNEGYKNLKEQDDE